VDDLAEGLDLRSLIGLGDVLGDERMETELLPDLPDEIRVGIDQVDPETGFGVGVEGCEGCDVGRPPGDHLDRGR
jgi:hypothetical protein